MLAAAVAVAVVAVLAVDAVAQGRGGRGGGGRGGRGGGVIPPLLMATDAFEDGGIIPERYAGGGGNVRPGFTFSNIPPGTVFELYALSGMLNLPPDATRAQLLDAMKDMIVGKAAHVGRFRQ